MTSRFIFRWQKYVQQCPFINFFHCSWIANLFDSDLPLCALIMKVIALPPQLPSQLEAKTRSDVVTYISIRRASVFIHFGNAREVHESNLLRTNRAESLAINNHGDWAVAPIMIVRVRFELHSSMRRPCDRATLWGVVSFVCIFISRTSGFLQNITVPIANGVATGIPIDKAQIKMSPGLVCVTTQSQYGNMKFTNISISAAMSGTPPYSYVYGHTLEVLRDLNLRETSTQVIMTFAYKSLVALSPFDKAMSNIISLAYGASRYALLPGATLKSTKPLTAVLDSSTSSNGLLTVFLAQYELGNTYIFAVNATVFSGDIPILINADVNLTNWNGSTATSIKAAMTTSRATSSNSNTTCIAMFAVQLLDPAGAKHVRFTDSLSIGSSASWLAADPFTHSLENHMNCSDYILLDLLCTLEGSFVVIFQCHSSLDKLGVLSWNYNDYASGVYVGQVAFDYGTSVFVGASILDDLVVIFYTSTLIGGIPTLSVLQVNTKSPLEGLNTTFPLSNLAPAHMVWFQRNYMNHLILAYQVQDPGKSAKIHYLAFCKNKPMDTWMYYGDSFLPDVDPSSAFGFRLAVSVDSQCNLGFLVQNASNSIYAVTGSALNYLLPIVQLSPSSPFTPPTKSAAVSAAVFTWSMLFISVASCCMGLGLIIG